MHPLEAAFKRKFKDPVVYAQIAEMLRDGCQMVKVKFRNRGMVRYYTGSGSVTNSGWGIRKRWNVHVQRFDNTENVKVYHHIPDQYVWNDPYELELLLAYDWDNVSEISAVQFSDHSADDTVKFLHTTASKLRPGQGYKFGEYHITKDLYGDDGYQFRSSTRTYHVPAHMITACQWTHNHPLDKMDPNKVIVVDENLIKRQHRQHKDIRRWYECKQVPSVKDRHALTFTPTATGQTPVFYYDLVVKIDDASKKGHPFYITSIVQDAVRSLSSRHSNCTLNIDLASIIIEWDKTPMSLNSYVIAHTRYPELADTQPIVIVDDIETEYLISEYKSFNILMVKNNG